MQSSMADGAPLPSGARRELSRLQQPLTSRAFVSNRGHKAKATISAELTSPDSPNLVALSSSREGEASLSQGFLRANNPWPCRSGQRAMPRGPCCDRSRLLVHTAPAPRSMGKGGTYFCCSAPCVCSKEQNLHPKKGNNSPAQQRNVPGCGWPSRHADDARGSRWGGELMRRVTRSGSHTSAKR